LEKKQQKNKGRVKWILPSRRLVTWIFSRACVTDGSRAKIDQDSKISR
jgi:hypothetical protein